MVKAENIFKSIYIAYFDLDKKELIPFCINANSITLSNFSESHLGRSVLQPSPAKYDFRSMLSITSQKVYTGSEISIIF